VKYITNGQQHWKPRRGSASARINSRRQYLVKIGKASWWNHYQNVEEALALAGL